MDTEGDVHTWRCLLEERCTDSEAGPVGTAGAGVGGQYSSDVPVSGLVGVPGVWVLPGPNPCYNLLD